MPIRVTPIYDPKVKRKRMGRGLPAKPGTLRKPKDSMGDRFRMEQRRRLMNKKRDNLPGGMLTGGQIKIAKKAPPFNKITGADFAVLQKEKAKGRGKGLQDEKMKPGKVMKANKGLAAGIGGLLGVEKRKGLTPEKAKEAQEKIRRDRAVNQLRERLKKFKQRRKNKPAIPLEKGKGSIKKPKPGSLDYQIIQTQPQRPSQILPRKNKGGVMKYDKGGMGEAKGYKKYLEGLKKAEGEQFRAKFKAKEIAKAGGKAALKAAKASRIGKIALGVAAVGLGAKEFLKRKMEKRKRIQKEKDAVRGLKENMAVDKLKEQVKKKMGGGMMMRRPMMASEGKMTIKDKTLAYSLGQSMKNKDRLTERDIKTAKGVSKPMSIKDVQVKKGREKAKKVLGKLRNVKNQATGFVKEISGLNKGGVSKKMGGGMMMRPNPVGMKSGKSVKVKCKLGRNKPTKMY